MTPDEVAECLMTWAEMDCRVGWRRVECVEPSDGVRVWLLWQGGRQVGNVRAWNAAAGDYALEMHAAAWTVEASRGIAREALGLHDAAEEGSP
jgi:hypothetical protein